MLEFMAGGDLRAAMNSEERGAEMLWHQRGRKVAVDVARGMSWLHSRRVRGSLSAAMRAWILALTPVLICVQVLHGDIKSSVSAGAWQHPSLLQRLTLFLSVAECLA